MSDEIEWPREIWMAERDEHDQGVVSAVLSEHATVARFDGDTERERDFHRYVDADIYETAERYWKASVAAAYEAAAELACERLADSWSWDDEDFLSCVIADLKRHIIEAGPTQKAKAALEQVRREARRNALLDAVAACRPHADDCALDRQAKAQCADMIQRLIDNPQEDET